MPPLTTGRTLSDGDPVPGTGFEVDPDGWLADTIAGRTGPVTSHPTRPVWGIPLPRADDDPETIRTLSVVGPGYAGPPEHYHARSVESFEVREGEVTFTLAGTDRTVSAGESITVETGTRHTFHNDGAERALMVAEIGSPGRLNEVLPTLGGLAHDPDRDPSHPLQRAAVATALSGNTVFTDQERPGVGALVEALAPVARSAGYRGAYGKYLQDAFWRRHVEQPGPELEA